MAFPVVVKKWNNNDLQRLQGCATAIEMLLVRNEILTSQNNPMFDYNCINTLMAAQECCLAAIARTTHR